MALSLATAGLISAGISGVASFIGGNRANVASAKEAQKNRDYQRQMSNTSHQREVRDLRKAGLNPILSAQKGASSPSGSMAQQRDAITPAVNSALAAKRLSADLANIQANTGKTNQDTANGVVTNAILKNTQATTGFTAEIEKHKLNALRKSIGVAPDLYQKAIDATSMGIENTVNSAKDLWKYGDKKWQLLNKKPAPERSNKSGLSGRKRNPRKKSH